MNGYTIVLLADMLSELGEDRTRSILSTFSCPLNLDIEYFLHRKAIEFAKQGLASTCLVFSLYRGKKVLIAYYTLAMKTIFVQKSKVSNNCYKRISKYGTVNNELKGCLLPAPLIAQLGKNFTDGYNKLISGDELLKLAADKVAILQQELSGRVVYLECEDKPKLVDFYRSNGFVEFGRRNVDRDEKERMESRELIQMLRINKI